MHAIGIDIGGTKIAGALVDEFGVDAVRYFLLREVPFGQDGSYSEESIIGRINTDLANELGNLAQRSLSMVNKNLDGLVPTPGAFTDDDTALLAHADGLLPTVRAHFDVQRVMEICFLVGLNQLVSRFHALVHTDLDDETSEQVSGGSCRVRLPPPPEARTPS